MVAAIAKTRTRTGIRRTSPAATLSVDVEAYTDLRTVGSGGEGGIDRVEFSIVVNGGAPSVVTVSSMSLRFPNYSAAASPMPGAPSGSMAPLWCYGTTLDCAVLAAGTIVCTPTVYSVAGTATACDPVTLYNDTDGADRRPSPKTIYVSPTGNNSNPGTIGSPVQTVQRGVNLAATSSDLAGAEVVLQTGDHQWAGGDGTSGLFTSGAWWLTIRCSAGARILRTGSTLPQGGVMYVGSHSLFVRGTGGGSSMRVRVILEDPTVKQIVGGGMQFEILAGTAAEVWCDGGRSGSAFHNASTKPWSVRFVEDSGQIIAFSNPTATQKRYLSCHVKEGCTFGHAGWTDLHDFIVTDCLGVALQATGLEEGNSAVNGIIERQRYNHEVAGFLDAFVGGKVTVSNVGGQMHIEQLAGQTIFQNSGSVPTTTVMDMAAQLTEIVGNTIWGVRCSGFTNGNHNGNFRLLSVGYTSGRPFLRLDNPLAASEAASGSARLETVNFWSNTNPSGTPGVGASGTVYTTKIHPDILQWQAPRTHTLHSHIAPRDFTGGQTWFPSGGGLTRCAMVNCSDGGSALRANFVGCTFLTDCLFLGNTFSGQWDFSGGVPATGTNIVNNVIGTSSNFPAATALATHNHFIGGATAGLNATSGAWFAGTPSSSPWSLQPAPGVLDTGSSLWPTPAEFRWSGSSGTTRGCWRNVGSHSWSTGVVMTVAAPAGLTLAAPTASMVTGVIMLGGLPSMAFDEIPDQPNLFTVGALMAVDPPPTIALGAPACAFEAGPASPVMSVALPAMEWSMLGLHPDGPPAPFLAAFVAGAVLDAALPAITLAPLDGTMAAGPALTAALPNLDMDAPACAFETAVLFDAALPSMALAAPGAVEFVVPPGMTVSAPAGITLAMPVVSFSVPVPPITPGEPPSTPPRTRWLFREPPWKRLPLRRWLGW